MIGMTRNHDTEKLRRWQMKVVSACKMQNYYLALISPHVNKKALILVLPIPDQLLSYTT